MFTPRTLRTTAIAAVCVLAGALAGIAGAGAHGDRHHGFGDHGFARGPVHAELVFPDRNGGFKTVTLDRGVVDSVSGDQLVVKEGTEKSGFRTVTLTIPGDARIRRGGEQAQLSDLQAGDRVAVISVGDKTMVKARPAGNKD